MILFSSTNGWVGDPAIPQSQFLGAGGSKLFEENTTESSMSGNIASANAAVADESALEWTKYDKRRMLHVVYRVGDMDRTIKYA